MREAAARLPDTSVLNRIDLVGPLAPSTLPPSVELITTSVATWTAPQVYELITCVHGLHYVGDRLGLLARAASWHTPQGLLIAHLDPNSIRCADGRPASRLALAALRAAGFTYSARHHRLTLRGLRRADLPWSYLGADPHAGTNYTGQPAVAWYYQPAMPGQGGIKPRSVPVGGPCHQPGGGRGA